MSNNISINTNQTPYFDDYDEDKSFHQVLYKPSLPVQARELSTQQSILRNQIKRFGDHVFKNGSKVTGGELLSQACKLIGEGKIAPEYAQGEGSYYSFPTKESYTVFKSNGYTLW